jgi:pimeloyl-[acyl-carrier protein] methyl ester esterase
MMIQTRGQGPDLVMLHGWGMNSGCWGSFADRLATRFRLHLANLPGHGLSMPANQAWDVQALISELLEKLPGAAWLGWSLGGQLALQAALQRPPAISHLVLISTNPCFVANRDWDCGMDPNAFANFSRLVELNPSQALIRFNGLQVAGSDHARSTLKILREKCAEAPPAPAGLKAGLEVLGDPGLALRLGDVRVPVLAIGGSADRLVPLEAVLKTSQNVPGAAFAAIEGAGHAPFISHEAEVLSAVSGFLTRGQAT